MRNLYLKQVYINIKIFFFFEHVLTFNKYFHHSQGWTFSDFKNKHYIPIPPLTNLTDFPNPIIIIIITSEYNNKLSLAM